MLFVVLHFLCIHFHFLDAPRGACDGHHGGQGASRLPVVLDGSFLFSISMQLFRICSDNPIHINIKLICVYMFF